MTLHTVQVVSWIGFHGRSESLAASLGGRADYVKAKGSLPVRYIRQFRETIRLIRSARADAVIVMMPPLPAICAVVLAARGRVAVWADLHTGVFENPRWRWALRATMWVIRKHCAGAIVTNESLARRAESYGLTSIEVLDDILEPKPANAAKDYVVFPVTYANDEPIEQIVGAARLLPEITFFLTGKPPSKVVDSAPANIKFPGFLPRSDFENLMSHAAIIGALTNRPYTMQRAGYEALELGTPLVTSSWADLRRYFGDAAVYTDEVNSAESIASAIDRVLKRRPEYRDRMQSTQAAKLDEQNIRLRRFNGMLAARGARS